MTSPRTSILRAALTVSAGSIASRILGLAREAVIAAFYGARGATDAYTAASRIPISMYDLLVGGAIAAALVPVFSQEAEEDEASFWQLIGAVFSLFSLVLAAVTVVLVVAAPQVLRLITSFDNPETENLSAVMLRVMAPGLLFFGVSGIATAALQARRQFTAPAFAAAAFNLTLTIVAIVGQGIGPVALAVGLLAGTIAQFVLQAIALRRVPFSWNPRHPALGRISRLYVPVLIGLVVSTAGVAIDTRLATGLEEGSPSAMRFATTLVQFALGVVAMAISTAYLPELSRRARGEGFGEALGTALRAMVTLIVPVTFALVAFRVPVIRLMFERGAFTPDDTVRTALAFLAYSPGIPAAAIDQVLIYAFYARQDAVRPVIVGVLSILIYLAVALTLVEPLGMVGLALANSAQWTGHAIIMAVLAARLLWPLHLGSILAPVIRLGVANVAPAALWFAIAAMLPTDLGVVFLLLALAAAGALGIVLYVGSLLLVRAPEAGYILGVVNRVRRR